MVYFNKIIEHDGYKFQSAKEFAFYQYLLELYKKEDIIVHPKFELLQKYDYKQEWLRNTACVYIADFQVENTVLDVKNDADFKQSTFRLKAKLFTIKYPDLELVVVFRKGKLWVQQ